MSLPILRHITTDRKSRGAERLLTLHDGIAPSDGHVVHHPLVHVALVNTLSQETDFFPVCLVFHFVRFCAEGGGLGDVCHERNLSENEGRKGGGKGGGLEGR